MDTALTIADIETKSTMPKGLIADDIIILLKDMSEKEHLEIKKTLEILEDWNLTVNKDKTRYIPLTKVRKKDKINKFQEAQWYKYLGLMINKDYKSIVKKVIKQYEKALTDPQTKRIFMLTEQDKIQYY